MTKKREITAWYGRIEDAPKYPDVPYWQARPDSEKFTAAWQMVIDAYAMKGRDIRKERLDKSVGGLFAISLKYR